MEVNPIETVRFAGLRWDAVLKSPYVVSLIITLLNVIEIVYVPANLLGILSLEVASFECTKRPTYHVSISTLGRMRDIAAYSKQLNLDFIVCSAFYFKSRGKCKSRRKYISSSSSSIR